MSQRSTIPLSVGIFGVIALVILAPYAGCHILTSKPAAVPVSSVPIATEKIASSPPVKEPEAPAPAESQGESRGGAGLAEIEQLLNK